MINISKDVGGEELLDVLPTYKGSYIIVTGVFRAFEKDVGAMGRIRFNKGFYYYTGSALGKGGIRKRVTRYLVLNNKIPFEKSGMKRTPNIHWHIDYLLSERDSTITSMFFSSKLTECGLVNDIKNHTVTTVPIPGFGSSDCRNGCPAHLLYSGEMLINFGEAVFDDRLNLKNSI